MALRFLERELRQGLARIGCEGVMESAVGGIGLTVHFLLTFFRQASL